MSSRFRLDLRDPDGTLFANVTDFLKLFCVERVNAPGLMGVTLASDHPALARLQKRSQVELWFDDQEYGIDWRRHFSALHLGEDLVFADEPGIFQLIVPGDKWLLGTRTVAWYAGYANRSEFISEPAETIMKTLVRYNCTPDATMASGRQREGAISGVAINLEADGGRGNSRDWYCHGDNVLKSLQDLAPSGGGDFELVKTGAAAWEFRFYPGQLGADRSASVLFARERDNMTNIQMSVHWMDEKTAATVWGQGEGALRAYETVLGPDYAADNDIEFYVDARDIAAGLTDRGTKVMEENRARSSFTFEVAQTPACMFARHYFLGDLVTVRNPRTMQDEIYQVRAVTLDVTGSNRITGIELRRMGMVRAPGGALDRVVDRLTRLERTISRLERLE